MTLSRAFPCAPAPCRYCGEAEWLSFRPEFADDHFVFDPAGSLVIDDDGKPAAAYVDYVECDMCGALAPLAIWNGGAHTSAERAAMIAYHVAEGFSPATAERVA